MIATVQTQFSKVCLADVILPSGLFGMCGVNAPTKQTIPHSIAMGNSGHACQSIFRAHGIRGNWAAK